MTAFDRHPRLRWTVPAVAGVVIAAAVVGAAGATADSGLPPKSPQELLVALQDPQAQALSGTVSISTDLGLPALPGSMGGKSAGPQALLSGTHTARVWTDGAGKSRVALLGDSDEYDVIRSGTDVWTWSSADNEARHLTLPADPAGEALTTPSVAAGVATTPQEAADVLLGALDPTTTVSTTGASTVAGRAVYELVLTPKQDGTRIGRVVIAADAQTSVPLSVRVYPAGSNDAAIDVTFASVDFGMPDAGLFTFTPPPGATVAEQDETADGAGGKDLSGLVAPALVGTGWTSVVVLPKSTQGPTMSGSEDAPDQLASLIDALPKVSGSWGSGRVLDGTLMSVILADDGRVAVGAVTPKVLEAALAAK